MSRLEFELSRLKLWVNLGLYLENYDKKLWNILVLCDLKSINGRSHYIPSVRWPSTTISRSTTTRACSTSRWRCQLEACSLWAFDLKIFFLSIFIRLFREFYHMLAHIKRSSSKPLVENNFTQKRSKLRSSSPVDSTDLHLTSNWNPARIEIWWDHSLSEHSPLQQLFPQFDAWEYMNGGFQEQFDTRIVVTTRCSIFNF